MSQTPIAGKALGLTRQNLLDLLFSDEEEKELGGFKSTPQKQYAKSYAQSYTPSVPLTASFTSKGKGSNVLGYGQGPSPSVTISGPIEQVIPLVPGATGGLGGPKPLPGARNIETAPKKEEKFLDTYIEDVKKELVYSDPGDKGAFGMKDYQELFEQGASVAEMRKIAEKSPYGVGTEAAKLLDLDPYTETKPWIQPGGQPSYTFTDPGSKNVFGMKDYYELLKQDIPKMEMERVARSMSGGIGPEAAKALGLEQYSYIPSS
jgi:hypothetical protein